MDKVILDTNGYRYLASKGSTNKSLNALMQKIKHKEKSKGIEPLLNPIAGRELLAHLTGDKWHTSKHIIRAIKALFYHNGKGNSYSAIPTPELLISDMFFNKKIERGIITNKAIGQLIYNIAKQPNKHTFTQLQNNLLANKINVDMSEQSFASVINNFFKNIDPESNGYNIFLNKPQKRKEVIRKIKSVQTSIEIALAYLYMVRELLVEEKKLPELSKPETIEILKSMTNNFINAFPEPIELQKEVYKKTALNNFDLSENNRANYLWDIQMMFYIGQNKIGNSKIIFVTSDKSMIKSALDTNEKNLILKYDEYMKYLDI